MYQNMEVTSYEQKNNKYLSDSNSGKSVISTNYKIIRRLPQFKITMLIVIDLNFNQNSSIIILIFRRLFYSQIGTDCCLFGEYL